MLQSSYHGTTVVRRLKRALVATFKSGESEALREAFAACRHSENKDIPLTTVCKSQLSSFNS